MQVLYRKAGRSTDGAQNIILMMREEENLNPINLKTLVSHTFSGCLNARFKIKSRHSDKYGNNGQEIVGVGGLVFPAGYVSVEERGRDRSGVCNIEVFYQTGEICWTSTIGKHK